jgi:hypothetical protein
LCGQEIQLARCGDHSAGIRRCHSFVMSFESDRQAVARERDSIPSARQLARKKSAIIRP